MKARSFVTGAAARKSRERCSIHYQTYDSSVASSKASAIDGAIQCFLLQCLISSFIYGHPAAAYVSFLFFPSFLPFIQ
jgi:hypothetical protein